MRLPALLTWVDRDRGGLVLDLDFLMEWLLLTGFRKNILTKLKDY